MKVGCTAFSHGLQGIVGYTNKLLVIVQCKQDYKLACAKEIDVLCSISATADLRLQQRSEWKISDFMGNKKKSPTKKISTAVQESE